ncbi:MAG TPA: type II toxin-antitoxin system RelE/ParE family toxin, partial [Pyrinomonadaceae bacterium]|nr:type II toxin-antitoxin system RelE/ParE family toxin [Pyrinomonadaceae bacterium]
MKVRYLTVANIEIVEAAEYYEIQKAGLGVEFLDELKRTEGRIVEHPKSWPRNLSKTHSCMIKRFPYSVIYYVAADEILIAAIHHHRRDPGRWEDRVS